MTSTSIKRQVRLIEGLGKLSPDGNLQAASFIFLCPFRKTIVNNVSVTTYSTWALKLSLCCLLVALPYTPTHAPPPFTRRSGGEQKGGLWCDGPFISWLQKVCCVEMGVHFTFCATFCYGVIHPSVCEWPSVCSECAGNVGLPVFLMVMSCLSFLLLILLLLVE